ncbi:MAG: hypothetical protein HOK49_15400 [Opitutae bacterium]|nr:hypothetical protein [Opitutae bacterium]MBT7852499.1 hypothetical protein [Opitutae bacterium]
MKGTTQIIILWGLSLSLAFFLGLQKGKERDPSLSLDVHHEVNGGQSVLPVRGASDIGITGKDFGQRKFIHSFPQNNGSGIRATDVVRIGSLLEEIKQPDVVRRMAAFTEALTNIDDAGLPMVLEAYEALPRGVQRYSELRMLMHAWAGFDPQGAIEYSHELGRDEGRFGRMVAVGRWAMEDTDAAIKWSKEQNRGHEGENPYMIGIIGGVVQLDLSKATDLLFEMPYGRNRGQALDLVVNKAMQDGGARNLIQWIQGFPADRDSRLMTGAYGFVANELSRSDFGLAKQWTLGLESGEPKQRAVSSVANRICETATPAEAAKWLSQMPQEDQHEAMPGIVRRWASRQPVETGEWLNKFPPSEGIDSAVETYVKMINHKNPESAREWAKSITDDDRRKRILDHLENPRGRSRQGQGGRD